MNKYILNFKEWFLLEKNNDDIYLYERRMSVLDITRIYDLKPETLDSLIKIDPTKQNLELLEPIARYYNQTGNIDLVDDYINKYWTLKSRRLDVTKETPNGISLNDSKYKFFNALKNIIDNLISKITFGMKYTDYSAGTDTYKKYGNPKFEIIQDDDNIFAAKLYNLAASIFFGDKQGWCTSDSTLSIFNDGEYYNKYKKNRNIQYYFIVDKKKFLADPRDKLNKIMLLTQRPIGNGVHSSRTKYITAVGRHNEDIPDTIQNYLKNIGLDLKIINEIKPYNIDLSIFSEKQQTFIINFGFGINVIGWLKNSLYNGVLFISDVLPVSIDELYKLEIIRNASPDVIVDGIVNIVGVNGYIDLKKTIDNLRLLKDESEELNLRFTPPKFIIKNVSENDVNYFFSKIKNCYEAGENINISEMKGIKNFILSSEFVNNNTISIEESDVETITYNIKDNEWTQNLILKHLIYLNSLKIITSSNLYKVELDIIDCHNLILNLNDFKNINNISLNIKTKDFSIFKNLKKLDSRFHIDVVGVESFYGLPEIIETDLNVVVANSKITLENFPKEIKGNLVIDGANFTEEELRKVCKISGNVSFKQKSNFLVVVKRKKRLR